MRPRIRFSLCGFLLAIACMGLGLGLVVRWWTKPYVLTGSHANGVRAWEQWEQRTMMLKLTHIKTLRFYTNGRKGFEFANGTTRYWSPTGQLINAEEYYEYFREDSVKGITDDQSERPYQAFLWWWNGW